MHAFRVPTVSSSNGRKNLNKPSKDVKNIVIFGETGVGKSSLINLIADEKVAETSSSAVGCTLGCNRYPLTIADQRFAIWDTAGLDEGTEGTVPAERAEAHLKQLLHAVTQTSGVDLLIYCVRGARVLSALRTNYHLFYSVIFRRKVPIAIVITGLENQEGSMDTWWQKNEKQFSALQMHFDNHACVTTLQPSTENATLSERSRLSRMALIKMITATSRTEQWKPGRSWANTALSDIHAMLSPRQGDGTHLANVILCDASRNGLIHPRPIKRSATFHDSIDFSLSCIGSIHFRSPVSAVDKRLKSNLPFDESMRYTPGRWFRLYQVPCKQISVDEEDYTKKDSVVKRGADLLIFCVKKRDTEDVKSQWEHFYRSYGGDLSPHIVVVTGAVDQQSAEEWWNKMAGGAVGDGDPCVTYWPRNETPTKTEVAKGRLRNLIDTRCMDAGNLAGDKRIFKDGILRRFHRMCSLPPIRLQEVNNNEEDISVPRQDILTEWGVWEHVQ